MNCFCLFIHEFTLLFIAFFLWIKINMKMPYLSTDGAGALGVRQGGE
jgi:hypothetical protein